MKLDNLLIELLVEELPPKALKKIGEAFKEVITQSLKDQGLLSDRSRSTGFATPRRLGVLINDVLSSAPDKQIRQKIMPVSVALNDRGQATPALIKKLQSLGLADLEISEMQREMDGKSETLFCNRLQPGVDLTVGLQLSLNQMLSKLPIPKVMSYQLDKGCEMPGWSTVHFVRPAHSLIALYGDNVLSVKILGLDAGQSTKGHRFESIDSVITIDHANDYERVMKERGSVIVGFEQRKAIIQEQLTTKAKELGSNYHPLEDDSLLEEVCALVEHPNVLTCSFESEFLQVPQECLILTMKANQKYFPLLDNEGRLTNKFLVVSNISPQDSGAVIEGNERVVRPRLADAKFFFDQDKKKTLDSRVSSLSKVVYHNLLGTQSERVQRVCLLTQLVCEQIGGSITTELTRSNSLMAARLAKADLLTDMVSEFPELQGIMGMYYALEEGLPEEVAFAIEDHYKPRFAGDSLARSMTGIVVSLADKLETLVGLFGIGQGPSGDKDPFALRRHTLGIIRMIVERELPLELTPLLLAAIEVFGDKLKVSKQELVLQIKGFIFDRMSSGLREQGFTAKEIDAVISQSPDHLTQIPLRVKAVHDFGTLPEAPALAAANKRIGNILKKENISIEFEKANKVNVSLLNLPAEKVLYQTLEQVAPLANTKLHQKEFSSALVELAALKGPTDIFFDEVMVNDPVEELRQNRLALLSALHLEMNRVGDLSKLA